MNINIKCTVCSHDQSEHTPLSDKEHFYHKTHWCAICSANAKYDEPNMFHDFKMDNLEYIEELAKSKGLI